MATNRKNLAAAIVATAPSPATSGTTLVLQAGYGAMMPAVPFFMTATPPGQLSTMGNSEIVQVTGRSGDTLTVVRAQKGTTAQPIAAGWPIANGVYVEDQLTPDNITATFQTGVPASVAITTNGWSTFATIVLPTTTVAHKYLIMSSVEFANSSGGSANEFATRFLDGVGAQFAIIYHDCHTGTYFTSSTLHAVKSSTGETIVMQGYSQAAGRATNSRGAWTVIDMGIA